MEKSKRNVIIITVTVVVIIAFVIAGIFIAPRVFYTKSFDSLVGDTSGGISKIVLFSGDTGEVVEITDQTEIDNVYRLFENTKFRVNWDQRPKTGFRFGISVYNSDGTELKHLTYVSQKRIVCDDRIYSMNRSFTEKEIDDLFKK